MNNSVLNIKQIFDPSQGYELLARYYSETKWYKFWNENEIPVIKEYLKIARPQEILDAGCGTSVYLKHVVGLNTKYTGIDISKNMLYQAKNENRKIQNEVKANFINISLEDFRNKCSYDTILCTRVLSHSSKLEDIFENFRYNLKRNGFLVLSDVHPSHNYENSAFSTLFGKIHIKTYKHPLEQVKSLITKNGFKILKLQEFSLNNLTTPPPYKDFEKLYNSPENNIFYTLLAQKI